MYADGKVLMGTTENGDKIYIEPKMANRHGLVAGATGTGKTVTLKTMAEGFSAMGVPVFLADVKGDLSGMIRAGEGENADTFPATYWDIFGKNGIPLRTTISEMGPLLLSRIMELTDTQADILTVVFKIADDNNHLLIDTKDLKAMLNHVSEEHATYEPQYGKLTSQSISAIIRAIVALESQGGDVFFGEPALSVVDWFSQGEGGKGMMHILDSSSLINNTKLYSTFLLWLMSELFETLPEVGDLDKPKMVFFFDEAHLLFKDAPKALLEKIEQVVKLIRSKGVGIYFITQNPRDIPDGVLSQLGNKVEHALHAYTPADQKAVKAAAESYPVNPAFDTYEAILSLGTGEAVVSFLNADGIPMPAEKVKIMLPQSKLGAIDATTRDAEIKGSILYTKYATAVDNPSAYEFFMRQGMEKEEAKAAAEAAKEEEKIAAQAAKDEAKAAEKAAKDAEKAKAKEDAAKKRAVKSVGSTVAGTVGREVGKQVGKSFGSFGKTLGGNLGASLGRNILSTLMKN